MSRRRKIIARGSFSRGFRQVDVERLFSGESSKEPSLRILAEAIEAMKRAEGPSPTEAEALEFAEAAKQIVDVPREQVYRAPSTRGFVGLRRLLLRPVVAGGIATLVLMACVSAGVAHAADSAIPGDSLYGLDLALEKIGIGNGGLKERLSEASQLADQGQALEGLEFASEAVGTSAPGDEGLEVAAAALQAAVEAASGDSGESESEVILTRVADLLTWMANTDLQGREFGRGVAELAREIGAEAGQALDHRGPAPQATKPSLPPQATEPSLPPQATDHR